MHIANWTQVLQWRLTSNNCKIVQRKSHIDNGWPTESHTVSIEQCLFQLPSTTSNQYYQFVPLFHAEYLRNAMRHSYNGILTGTDTSPSRRSHFKWPWVTSSDLAKYAITHFTSHMTQLTVTSLKNGQFPRLCWLKGRKTLARTPETFFLNVPLPPNS